MLREGDERGTAGGCLGRIKYKENTISGGWQVCPIHS